MMQKPLGVYLIDLIRKCIGTDKFKFYQSYILFITYISYFVVHLVRKPLPVSKSQLHHHNCSEIEVKNSTYWCDWSPFDNEDAKSLLGLLDTCYLICFAVFMFIAGYIAERSNLRYYLTLSILSCGLFVGLFGMALPLKIHSLYYFIIIQILSGIAQATAWPGIIACVGNWFGSAKKGMIFGIWNSHGFVGNIVGAAVAGALVEINWGYSFIVPGFIGLFISMITFFFLIPSPQDVGLSLNKDLEKNKEDSKNQGQTAISFIDAIKIPGVIEFSLCVLFAKFVSFTFLYWLPLYINESTKASSKDSAFLSIWFDIGSVLGGVIAGYISDKSGASAITCILMLFMGVPSLYIYYKFSTYSKILNGALQTICGIMVCGPYTLIITAVSTELANKIPSKSAVATVSGLVVGSSNIGGAIGPAIAGFVSKWGWDKVFYTIMVADMLASVALLRIGYNEFKRLKNKT